MTNPPHRTKAKVAAAIAVGAIIIIAFGATYFVFASGGSRKSTTQNSQTSIVLTSPVPSAILPSIKDFEGFGWSVAVSGNVVIVGAPNETVSGEADSGRAYIFNAQSGALVSTLTSPNPERSGEFGLSVAANGTDAVIGAPSETADGVAGAGHAYIFNTTTGLLLMTLTSPAAQSYGGFGSSVAASSRLVVVGADDEEAGGALKGGHAYAFLLSTGTSADNLTSPVPAIGGWFGESVAVAGSFIVVGAPHEYSDGLQSASRAYVFNGTTGRVVDTLASPNPQTLGGFGLSVAANKANVIVGAPFENASGLLSAGHVYVFGIVSGALLDGLHSPNADTGGNFGWSVAADPSAFVVGATYDRSNGTTSSLDSGLAYVFDFATTSLMSTLTTPSVSTGFGFGFSVALGSGMAVASNPFTIDSNASLYSNGVVVVSH